MPTAREIESALYELAPETLVEEWDNVGLLVGRPDRDVKRVLMALDVTEGVADEAIRTGANLIVAHHPVMNCAWSQVQNIRDDKVQGRLLLKLIENGVAAICMHTNLDAAPGGINDILATALGLEQVELLRERHGIARMGLLPEPMDIRRLLARIKDALRPNGMRYVDGGKALIRRVAVGSGACGRFFRAAAEQCDAFVTADVKYDEFLDAQALGLTLIDAGHFPTEDVVCPMLVRYLGEKFPELEIQKSSSHREAIQYYV